MESWEDLRRFQTWNFCLLRWVDSCYYIIFLKNWSSLRLPPHLKFGPLLTEPWHLVKVCGFNSVKCWWWTKNTSWGIKLEEKLTPAFTIHIIHHCKFIQLCNTLHVSCKRHFDCFVQMLLAICKTCRNMLLTSTQEMLLSRSRSLQNLYHLCGFKSRFSVSKLHMIAPPDS